MKKDIVYSIRMNTLVREALKRAAKKERRTVASLLDKIILDYLEGERYLLPFENSSERRSFQRNKITLPAVSVIDIGDKEMTFPCVITDIALGGVLINYPKGSPVKSIFMKDLPRFNLLFRLPQTGAELRFCCDVRRLIEENGEFQVGAIFYKPDEDSLNKIQNYLI